LEAVVAVPALLLRGDARRRLFGFIVPTTTFTFTAFHQ